MNSKPLILPAAGAECKHLEFDVQATINRLTDIGRFQAEIRIQCLSCHVPFTFLGLRKGVINLNGAVVSPDGAELRAAIFPNGKPLTKIPDTMVNRVNIRRRK